MDAPAHLSVLARLLDLARPGALFPDAPRVREWLELLQRPFTGRTVPKLELHAISGFPTPRSLARLQQRQRLAKAFFAAHQSRPPRSSDQFNAALAATELWAPGTEAKVMTAERARQRVLVVHDRFDAKTATLQRFSIQLEQQKAGKHVKLQSTTACTCTPSFALAVEQACDAGATEAALRLGALEGLSVHEAVKGELGPCVTASFGALPPLQPGGEDGVLSLVLERVGSTVTADFRADAWPSADAHAPQRAAKGWKLSRERKLVCTPALEPELKKLAAASRMLVRSR
jgi:hypothetical protein